MIQLPAKAYPIQVQLLRLHFSRNLEICTGPILTVENLLRWDSIKSKRDK